MECESRPGLGCLVFGTPVCAKRHLLANRLRRWMRVRLSLEMRWVLLAALPLVLCWLWTAGFLL